MATKEEFNHYQPLGNSDPAVAADQTSTTLTFYKSGSFRYEDVLWPEAASDETKKRTAFAGTAISIV